MLLQNKKVCIIGGGPGGLTLARLLQLKNVDIKVYERDAHKDVRVQGAPLDLHDESGLAAIIRAGLQDEFKNNYLPGADRMKIMNEQAEIFFNDHEDKPEENFGNADFRPEIDRGALRKLLLESLQPEIVMWDSHFMAMEKQNKGWLLHFKNGKTVYADIVIGADGVNSKLRPFLTDMNAFYSGITMLEGNIYNGENHAPQIAALLEGGKIMAFGKEQVIIIGRKGGGVIGFYISLKAGEHWAADSGLDFSNKAQLLAWFKHEYKEWSPFWQELLEKTETKIIPRPIYCIPFDQTWESRPDLTILGDAAHVMPPFAGEGVNMAMLDALELSENLTTDKYDTLQNAIEAYEINMRKRAALVARESLDNGAAMHSENALQNMLQLFANH